jgi:pyruvate dehydrogenase E2 component (dihydrolipoamide acetyltransferase)
MSHILTLPRLGETMESGRVVGWLKQPGDSFRRGETIVEIESDKTVVELPALSDGLLIEVLAAEGADIEVGAPLCRYQSAEDASPGPAAELPTPAAVAAPPPAIDVVPVSDAATVAARLRATPVARRLARQAGIDLASLHGSGRRGRIEARDVTMPGGAAPTGLAVQRWAASAGGVPALLLHGFGGDAQTWAALATLLAQRGFAVAAPDLPGHGATTLDATDMAGLAAPLESLLDGPARVELIGHSLGAAVAVRLARAHPQRVARLTLIAPAGLDSAIDAEFVTALAETRAAGGLSHLLRRLSPRPPLLSAAQLTAMVAQLARGRLADLAQALVAGGRQQIDIIPDLAALPMPVRVVWGLDDRIIPWTQVARLPSRVAVHLVAGAGHLPHWDAPHDIAALFDR